MTYGIMPARDYQTFDETLSLLSNTFPEGILNTLEIGVHKGPTSIGIRNYLRSIGRDNFHAGIDNQRDFKMNSPFPECNFIIGDSKTSFSKIKDNSQHLLFIDGNHNYPSTIIDFLMYKDKVKENGFIMFHDCGKQIKPFTDYQGEGEKDDPDMYISCRKAVDALGLIKNQRKGFFLISDNYESDHPTGGIIVIQKATFNLNDDAWFYRGEIPMLIKITKYDLEEISKGKESYYAPVEKHL